MQNTLSRIKIAEVKEAKPPQPRLPFAAAPLHANNTPSCFHTVRVRSLGFDLRCLFGWKANRSSLSPPLMTLLITEVRGKQLMLYRRAEFRGTRSFATGSESACDSLSPYIRCIRCANSAAGEENATKTAHFPVFGQESACSFFDRP